MKFQLLSLTTIYLKPECCVAYALTESVAMLKGLISPSRITLFVESRTFGWLDVLGCWLQQVHRLTPPVLRNSMN